MDGQHDYTNIVANVVLSIISYFTRVVFGEDHLTKWQLVAFLCCCIAWVWIISLLNVNKAVGGGLSLTGGLIIPSMIRVIIKGSKAAESPMAKSVEKNVEKIANKVDTITDVITHNQNNPGEAKNDN